MIIGQNGFIGNYLSFCREGFEIIPFKKEYFNDENKLDKVVSQSDIIVHLAGLNKHKEEQVIYNTNILLTKKLISSIERTSNKPHIIFSSSTQESQENLYGKSKLKCSKLLEDSSKELDYKFTSMVTPNVFGAFGKPFYNSVISTFCYQLNHNEIPEIQNNTELKLIYINQLIEEIYKIITKGNYGKYLVLHTKIIKVSEVLDKLKAYKKEYLENFTFPKLKNDFEINLFNTFRSYIEYKKVFPVKLNEHKDEKGSFVETIKEKSGGQISFSTTKKAITRGEHFHLRKIERFIVVKGKALIQMRKIGANEVLEFELDGENPSFIDIPIWYTHNIKNIGNEDLYTMFYINEFFNKNDTDTYLKKVK